MKSRVYPTEKGTKDEEGLAVHWAGLYFRHERIVGRDSIRVTANVLSSRFPVIQRIRTNSPLADWSQIRLFGLTYNDLANGAGLIWNRLPIPGAR